MFDQHHHVYKADSTKIGKTIAMMLASHLLGPDWSRYAVHHYNVENNAVRGVSYIQLQSKWMGVFEKDRIYLEVTEPGQAFDAAKTFEMTLKIGDRQISSTFPSWTDFDNDEIRSTWYWLRLCGKDGQICTDEDLLLHPDNRA
jgi:hypothetical protein